MRAPLKTVVVSWAPLLNIIIIIIIIVIIIVIVIIIIIIVPCWIHGIRDLV